MDAATAEREPAPVEMPASAQPGRAKPSAAVTDPWHQLSQLQFLLLLLAQARSPFGGWLAALWAIAAPTGRVVAPADASNRAHLARPFHWNLSSSQCLALARTLAGQSSDESCTVRCTVPPYGDTKRETDTGDGQPEGYSYRDPYNVVPRFLRRPVLYLGRTVLCTCTKYNSVRRYRGTCVLRTVRRYGVYSVRL